MPDLAHPAVTVVIPLFNGAAFIEETLTSIQAQTTSGVEVIVVDDGSDDDGPERARRHAVGAVVVEQAHLGVAVARNRGLAAARGGWITFIDQDDLWHPSHLERLLGWLDANPQERVAFAREIAFSVSDESDELRTMDQLAGEWAQFRVPREGSLAWLVEHAETAGTPRVERHDVRGLLRGPISVTTSFIADPALLRLAGGFAPHALAMDDYWLLVNVARLQPIPQLDQPTVFYRVHVRATSRTTRLGLPFLASAAALRLGGGLIPLDEGLAGGGLNGKLHRHLLHELRRDEEYRRRGFRDAVDHLAAVLWPPDGLARERRRARLAARMPWLRRAIRSVRKR